MSTTHVKLTKTIVEIQGKGYVQFNLIDKPSIPPSSLKPDQVAIQILASPINPSDIGPLFSPSHGGIGKFDNARTTVDGNGRPVTLLPIPGVGKYPPSLLGRAVSVGNEGAGHVVAAGTHARHLVGKLVSYVGGGSYSQQVVRDASSVLVPVKTLLLQWTTI